MAKANATLSLERDAMRVRQKGAGPGTATMIIFGLKNFAREDYSADDQRKPNSEDEIDKTVAADAPTLNPDGPPPASPVL